MKKYLFAYAVLATALLFFTCRHYRAENRRLVENQTALTADVTRYRTRLGAEAASVQALRLRCGEFETLRAADAAQIRRLGIRLRRLEAAAKAVAVTDAEIRTPLRDPWISVEGRIGRDSAACRIRSVDTLRQAVHRIPRRFLFIRWGTKALRQEIVSTNPHTRIVYAEYVKIER